MGFQTNWTDAEITTYTYEDDEDYEQDMEPELDDYAVDIEVLDETYGELFPAEALRLCIVPS